MQRHRLVPIAVRPSSIHQINRRCRFTSICTSLYTVPLCAYIYSQAFPFSLLKLYSIVQYSKYTLMSIWPLLLLLPVQYYYLLFVRVCACTWNISEQLRTAPIARIDRSSLFSALRAPLFATKTRPPTAVSRFSNLQFPPHLTSPSLPLFLLSLFIIYTFTPLHLPYNYINLDFTLLLIFNQPLILILILIVVVSTETRTTTLLATLSPNPPLSVLLSCPTSQNQPKSAQSPPPTH